LAFAQERLCRPRAVRAPLAHRGPNRVDRAGPVAFGAVVVPELKLREAAAEVVLADAVEHPVEPALQEKEARPQTAASSS
jgi:hypothetical protein